MALKRVYVLLPLPWAPPRRRASPNVLFSTLSPRLCRGVLSPHAAGGFGVIAADTFAVSATRPRPSRGLRVEKRVGRYDAVGDAMGLAC
jgi:hypothetical protein